MFRIPLVLLLLVPCLSFRMDFEGYERFKALQTGNKNGESKSTCPQCCQTFSSSTTWTVNVITGTGSVDAGGSQVRLNFADSGGLIFGNEGQCPGGTDQTTQVLQAVATVTLGQQTDIMATWEGIGEPDAEAFALEIDGSVIFYRTIPTAGCPPGAEIPSCTMCTATGTYNYSMPAGTHTVKVMGTTQDSRYHVDAGFKVHLAMDPCVPNCLQLCEDIATPVPTPGPPGDIGTSPPTASPPNDGSVAGDPHVANMQGEHFDIRRPGWTEVVAAGNKDGAKKVAEK